MHVFRDNRRNQHGLGHVHCPEGVGLTSIFEHRVSAVEFTQYDGFQGVDRQILWCLYIFWLNIFIMPGSIEFYKFTGGNLRSYLLFWNDYFNDFVFEVTHT